MGAASRSAAGRACEKWPKADGVVVVRCARGARLRPRSERSTLYEAGLLDPDEREEREELVSYWRGEYERANRPGFSICQGPDRPWLTGPAGAQSALRVGRHPGELDRGVERGAGGVWRGPPHGRRARIPRG